MIDQSIYSHWHLIKIITATLIQPFPAFFFSIPFFLYPVSCSYFFLKVNSSFSQASPYILQRFTKRFQRSLFKWVLIADWFYWAEVHGQLHGQLHTSFYIWRVYETMSVLEILLQREKMQFFSLFDIWITKRTLSNSPNFSSRDIQCVPKTCT